jgi:hypothetical protein
VCVCVCLILYTDTQYVKRVPSQFLKLNYLSRFYWMDISLVEIHVHFYWLELVIPGFASARPLYLLMTSVYIYCLLGFKWLFSSNLFISYRSHVQSSSQVKVSNRCNQIYIFIVYVLILHVSGPHWPIIRSVLGCLFMPPFGSCSVAVYPCVRGSTDIQQHCMSQMVA